MVKTIGGLFALGLVALCLAGCETTQDTATLATGQKVVFVTGKGDIFGAPPTTAVFAQDHPGAPVYRPLGVTQGAALETTLVSGAANAVGLGVGEGLASRLVGSVSSTGGGVVVDIHNKSTGGNSCIKC